MNTAEVNQFVELEIANRYKTLSDTSRADWVRAVWTAKDFELCRRIIRELVDDPEESLSLKGFYRKLKASHAPRAGLNSEIPCWSLWVRCLEAPADHPTWQDREWFRLEGPKPIPGHGCSSSRFNDKAYMQQKAHDITAEIQQHHGGTWTGIVRPEGQLPQSHPLLYGPPAAEWAKAHILDGPEGPGKRFLEKLAGRDLMGAVAASLPKVEMPPKAALPTRAELDEIGSDEPGATQPDDPKPLPAGHVELTGELPEADGAFFESENADLAKENA